MTVVLLVVAVAPLGCGGNDKDTAPRASVIDEERGSYRGVALGDPPQAMYRVFGEKAPAEENEPTIPASLRAGDPSYGPWHIPYGGLGRGRTAHYRYAEAVFAFHRDELIWFETIEPGAATSAGVAIGDPLRRVERAYARAICGTAGGGEYGEYPACVVKLGARRSIWFGGDPVASITVGAVPLVGVSEEKPFTGQVFTLTDGEFVTYPPGKAKPGDKIACEIGGKRIETTVPPRNTGVSTDPMYVATKPDGAVRAECGGIHAETAPPGSW